MTRIWAVVVGVAVVALAVMGTLMVRDVQAAHVSTFTACVNAGNSPSECKLANP